MKSRAFVGVIFGMVLLFTSTARADEGSKQEASAQGFGFFTTNSTGRGLRQTSTNGGGFLVSYRYHFFRWLAADVSYGRTRDTTRTFTPTTTLPVQADIHEATAAGVVTFPSFGRIKPYVLAGSGALTFVPTQNRGGFVPGAGNKAQAVFLYGGGADYDFTRHFAFRLEYRGFVYKRPDFGLVTLRTDTTTHTAQPSAGIVFRF
jgi:opacity protein-like surface antigen